MFPFTQQYSKRSWSSQPLPKKGIHMSKPSFPSLLKLVTLFCAIVLIMPTAALAQSGGAGTNATNLISDAKPAAATFASYYISPTGSDSNPGTLAAPFQTIAKARDVVRTVSASMNGDIYVYLRGGTYNIASPIAFGPQDSGNNGYRVYYQAYSGETPILNGATKVTGWTQYSGNIYR